MKSTITSLISFLIIVSGKLKFSILPFIILKLTIAAAGDLTKADVEINKNEDITIEMDASEPQRSKYSVEYLKKMMQGSKLSDTVTLKFSKDYPVTIEYKEVDKLNLMFILAPRVDND